ncbi:TetR/AcrR family transcriptional regulator [Winogradskya humida]|uniref:HTH tetR-type domain-containing protein n=1 Tax=Winogradskya humida TaxID=113566 RepID=A0ABQ3ZHV7_9ACTN|nr:TetR/AcrR family transcriptional regulator [Actinoplanes humidus]GIE18183.1 hypothetical protein Ahu01nite_012850 [Actinoplanes humidus]
MSAPTRPEKVRADAVRSTARILEAAEDVLAVDPNASLEKIADAAGLARATVHRRFASRKALLEALDVALNERYLAGLQQARVSTAPPLAALYRLIEITFEIKIRHRPVVDISQGPGQEVLNGLDLLFTRLHDAGVITASGPVWCRTVFLALLTEVHLLPADAPELAPAGNNPPDDIGARSDLLLRTVIGALGGSTGPELLG